MSKDVRLKEDDTKDRRMTDQDLEDRMRVMRQMVVEDLNDRLNDMMSELIHHVNISKSNGTHEVPKKVMSRSQSKDGNLLNKKFIQRNSVLTDLFDNNPHVHTMYNIFLVILIILFLSTVVHDIVETGTIYLGIRMIQNGFAKFPSVVLYWCCMMGATLSAYVVTSFWAQKHMSMVKSCKRKVLDYGFFIAFLAYQISFCVFPVRSLLREGFPPPSSFIILMEQVRMLMKTHAFVRSVVPRVLSYKEKDEDQPEEPFPKFSKFLYFMFAPTLVYRDKYPRTSHVRWQVVVSRFSEVLLTIFYVSFIVERLLVPPYSKFNTHLLDSKVYVQFFGTVVPGILMFLCGFYCLLHAWMNGWAEMLRFADRRFYEDWWNCRSYDVFYRTWNIPIHDWLYAYVYKDMYEKLTKRNKAVSALTVFIISALVHEYILALAFGFFYPVMLTFFGFFGVMLFFLTSWSSKYWNSNIFIWFSLLFGNGLMYALYTIEYFARMNCIQTHDGLLDFFIPRSWDCQPIAVANESFV